MLNISELAAGFLLALLPALGWASLFYFVIINSFYALLMLAACAEMLRHTLKTKDESLWRMLGSGVAPTISMLAPAYNEANTIVESVRSLLSIYYPNLEIIVVNDGSTDQTMEILISQFELAPIHPIYQQQIDTMPAHSLYRSRNHPNLIVAD